MGERVRIGSFGSPVDIDLSQGTDFPVTLTIRNPSTINPVTGEKILGTPVNLTGCQIEAQIRRRALDSGVLAIFEATIVNAVGGVVSLKLDSIVTTSIKAGETLKDALSNAVWDAKLIDSLGFKSPVCYGDVLILRTVTRGI